MNKLSAIYVPQPSSYTYINIDTNGYIEFAGIDLGFESIEYRFRQNKMISVLWDDLEGTVYKNNYSDRVVFTWDGQYVGGGTLRFQAVLYKNGDIKLRYDNLEENRSSTIVGISAGDNANYT